MEIERKFLLVSDGWISGVTQTFSYKDGLLAHFGQGKARIRHRGDRAWVTIKRPRFGISRAEYEYEIPTKDTDDLFALCGLPHIEKIRHIVPYAGLIWMVDIHQGPLAGIEFAEVQLDHPEHSITLPPWVGEEVTNDLRYRKRNLLKRMPDAR
jgi:CYTH domain-containing protein